MLHIYNKKGIFTANNVKSYLAYVSVYNFLIVPNAIVNATLY